MKVAVCSDLHLEFGHLTFGNPENADVLVLSGDVLVANHLKDNDVLGLNPGTRSDRYHLFLQECCEAFPHVVYVLGNHEHYDGDFPKTVSHVKEKLAYLENLHVLEREVFRYKDFVFAGSTLWTDMNENDPMTLSHMRTAMNDFRLVDNSNRKTYRKVPLYKKGEDGQYVRDEKGRYVEDGMKMKEEVALFSPQDAMEEFHKNVAFLRATYEDMAPWESMVVVGHHAPSRKSTHPKYAHDTLMNGGYSSELSDFMLDRPGVKLWTHGHTHEQFDYMVGECRVVCNPRGYVGYEESARNFKLKVVEL